MYIRIDRSSYHQPKESKKSKKDEPTEKDIQLAKAQVDDHIEGLKGEYSKSRKKGAIVGTLAGGALGTGLGYLYSKRGNGDGGTPTPFLVASGLLGAGTGALAGYGIAQGNRERTISEEGRKTDQYLLGKAGNKREREALKKVLLSRYKEPTDYVTENGQYVKGTSLYFDRDLMKEIKRERDKRTLGGESFSASIKL